MQYFDSYKGNKLSKLSVAIKLITFTFVFVALFIVNAVSAQKYEIVIQLSIGLLFLIFLRFYLTENTYPIVIALFAWFATVLVTLIAWENGGVWDSSLFAFTGILLLSTLYGGRLLSIPILVYMVISIYGIQYAAIVGLITPTVYTEEMTWAKANSLVIFTVLYGFALDHLIKVFKDNQLLTAQASKSLVSLIEEQGAEATRFRTTKLPNELAAQNSIEQCKLTKGRAPAIVAIKLTNYDSAFLSYGNKEANKLLVSLSETIEINPMFSVFQMSENVLLVLLDLDEQDPLDNAVHTLSQMLYMPLNTDASEFSFTFIGGAAQYPYDGQAFNILLNNAMIALDFNATTQQISHFTPQMEIELRHLIQVNSDLKKATSNGTFELYYQPKVCLKNNVIIGAEALIRWKNKNEYISPEIFIGLAEKNGYIASIGKWVLEQACFDCKAWNTNRESPISVAVNISPAQFVSGRLPKEVTRVLTKSNLSPNLLELEITESMEFESYDIVVNQIELIKELGVIFSIDDFGTGYSNLSNIVSYKASTLKIDRAFVSNLKDCQQNFQLIQSILNIAKVYNMSVVAEGIEDKETSEILSELGCEIGQGYYWSAPVPYDKFVKLLAS